MNGARKAQRVMKSEKEPACKTWLCVEAVGDKI
jgi:hypothetical protein